MGNEIRTKAASESRAGAKVNPQGLSERELVDRVIANDGAAWMELQRRYEKSIRGAIFGVLRRYAAVLESDAREDVMQDFYLSLLENDRRRLRVFDPSRSKLSTWLRLLACNKATNHARKVVNRPRTIDIDELLAQEDFAAEEDETGEVRSGAPRERYDVLDAHVWWKAAKAAKKEGR